MKTKTVIPLSVALAGAAFAAACAPPTTPPPAQVPANGCYTGGAADAKVVGPAGSDAGLEFYDGGSDCLTNVTIGATQVTYVAADDAIEAEAACADIDPAYNHVSDLAAWDTPAPGLEGYFTCSTK